MLDLNKYIVDPEPGKPLHSTGYAEIANAGRVGAVSPVSFNDRQQIEQTRKAVGSYDRSILGQSYGAQRAKTVASGNVDARTSMRARSGPGLPGNIPTRGFSEPSGRSYNPYA
jgi:hypothetical protein